MKKEVVHVCGFATDDLALEATRAKRKTRKVWFAGGAPAEMSQTEFQTRIMSGLSELSIFTNTDFISMPTSSGAYLRVFVATDQMMRKKWKDPLGLGRVPLALQAGNWIYYTVRPTRWKISRLLEGATLHEFGHRVGLKHVSDTTSIMHRDLTTTFLNDTDRVAFQKKLGKRV